MSRDTTISDAWLELGSSKSARTEEMPLLAIRVGTSIADAERTLILATLEHYDGQKERTAAVLGVSLKTLYNRLKEYAVDTPPKGNGGSHGATPASPDA
jgi:DNA-binding NtrC family response regulator